MLLSKVRIPQSYDAIIFAHRTRFLGVPQSLPTSYFFFSWKSGFDAPRSVPEPQVAFTGSYQSSVKNAQNNDVVCATELTFVIWSDF
jgi:hypothetical protein